MWRPFLLKTVASYTNILHIRYTDNYESYRMPNRKNSFPLPTTSPSRDKGNRRNSRWQCRTVAVVRCPWSSLPSLPIIQASFDGLKFQSACRDVRLRIYSALESVRVHTPCTYAYALPRSEDSYADRRFPRARTAVSVCVYASGRYVPFWLLSATSSTTAVRRSHPNCTACAKGICINAAFWAQIPRWNRQTIRNGASQSTLDSWHWFLKSVRNDPTEESCAIRGSRKSCTLRDWSFVVLLKVEHPVGKLYIRFPIHLSMRSYPLLDSITGYGMFYVCILGK